MKFLLNNICRNGALMLCAGLLVLYPACNASAAKQQGIVSQEDSYYFVALTELRRNDEAAALKHFERAARNASSLIARRSMERIAALSDVQKRIKICYDIIERYNDGDAYLFAAKELYANKEYQQIIQLTNELQLKEIPAELISLRLYALNQKGDRRFLQELIDWTENKAYTSAHYSLYQKIRGSFEEDTPENTIYRFRAAVHIRDYDGAIKLCEQLKTFVGEEKASLTPYLVSDMGKACLYGSTDNAANARYFIAIAENEANTALMRFYAAFYAGRLFNKNTSTKKDALEWLNYAMEIAPADDNYDNALWYYLDSVLNVSVERAIEETMIYAHLWHDAPYFDDFFESLSVRMLTQHFWQKYYEVYQAIDGFASDDVTAKFAYISGRLLEEGIIDSNDPKEVRMQNARNAFTRACRSGSAGTYYRLLAAKKLGLKDEVFLYSAQYNQNFKADRDTERLLEGYAYYLLPEFLYPEWQKLRDKIGIDTAVMISAYLHSCVAPENNYQVQSLRIMAYAVNTNRQNPQIEALRLLYPQNFMDDVTAACTRFEQEEDLMLGLIRSESFFDPKIRSYVGAQGLTQLMQPTAADIAGRLRIRDFDLDDSTTNVLFGCYYLRDMILRLGSSKILAIFSYNSGISRVRNWIKAAKLDLAEEFPHGQIPMDIFLEILPYEETREYGRKVVSAAAMYGALYYNKSTAQVISELM